MVPQDESFVIHPGEFCLGRTLEWVELPDDIVARIEGKSSSGRLGLIVHATAGFCDPGWKGTLTLELNNLTRVPIKLYPGLPIAQLSFMSLDRPALRPYGSPELGSHYQGQRAATEIAATRAATGSAADSRKLDRLARTVVAAASSRRRALEGAVLHRRRCCWRCGRVLLGVHRLSRARRSRQRARGRGVMAVSVVLVRRSRWRCAVITTIPDRAGAHAARSRRCSGYQSRSGGRLLGLEPERHPATRERSAMTHRNCSNRMAPA